MRQLAPLFTDFGALQTEGESTTRPPGTASTCTNWRVGRGGKTLRKVHGASRYSASQVNGSDPILGLAQFQDMQGEIHEVARTPTGYYERNLATDTWSLISAAATSAESDAIPMFAATQGKLFIVDGYSAYIYDPATASTLATWARLTGPENGIVEGTENRPSVELAAGGSLVADAEYEVFFTFADNSEPTKESPPSEIMRIKTTSVAAGKAIQINTGYAGRNATVGTNPAILNRLFHLPTDVAALGGDASIYPYVSAADEPGVWWRGTALTIAQAETEQKVTITAESTANQFKDYFGPPRYASGIVLHYNRLWTWGSPAFPTRLWFTEMDQVATFPADNFIDVGVDEPQDPVRACIPYDALGQTELLILKLNSVYRMSGARFSSFLVQRLLGGPSCISDRSFAIASDGTVFWAGYEGAYRIAAGQVLNISQEKIRDDWRASNGLVAVN